MNTNDSSYGRSKKGLAFIFITCGAFAGFAISGCATIIHGTRQDVSISSSPSGADVWVDNSQVGQTPVIAHLSRKDSHIVKLVLPGYQPYETTITRSVSGWVWGNIAFGGLIGLGVDAISGGIYKLSPEQVSGELAGQRAAGLSTDGIYILVAMKPQHGWELVGQLQKSVSQ